MTPQQHKEMSKDEVINIATPLIEWAESDRKRGLIILAFETTKDNKDLESLECVCGDEDLLVPALATKILASKGSEYAKLVNKANKIVLAKVLLGGKPNKSKEEKGNE